MRRVKKSRKIPLSLSLDSESLKSEKLKARKHYQSKDLKGKNFKFKVYKNEDVKEALENDFSQKCAYCESKYDVNSPVDVEHFRPKARIETPQGQKIVPGYYWLAANWDNLLPSCIHCNRRMRRKIIGEAVKQLCGKGDLFPIVNEKDRARKEGDEKNEKYVLLNPCKDDPLNYLEFDFEGGVIPKKDLSRLNNDRAQQTIEILGLQRESLAFKRRDAWEVIRLRLDVIELKEFRLSLDPKNKTLQDSLDREIELLIDALGEDKEYIGFLKFLLDKKLSE